MGSAEDIVLLLTMSILKVISEKGMDRTKMPVSGLNECLYWDIRLFLKKILLPYLSIKCFHITEQQMITNVYLLCGFRL